MKSRRLRVEHVMLAGPLPLIGEPLGGTKVSFEMLVNSMRNVPGINPLVFDTSRPLCETSSTERFLLNLSVILAFLKFIIRNSAHSTKLIWNVSSGGLFMAVIPVLVVTKIFRIKVIVRVFGGDFQSKLDTRAKPIRKLLEKVVFNFHAVALQTKVLVSRYNDYGNVHWFPTTRVVPEVFHERESCRNILYVGQIRPEKGLDLLPELNRMLRALKREVRITVCGASLDEKLVCDLVDSGVEVVSQLPHDQVLGLYKKSDAFLFPTRYIGEGYPGAVIEALQSGLPVITTDWNFMKEIVSDGKNGLIVDGTVASILDSILYMTENQDAFRAMSREARASGVQYCASNSVARLLKLFAR